MLRDEYGDVPVAVTATGTTLTVAPLRVLSPNTSYKLKVATSL